MFIQVNIRGTRHQLVQPVKRSHGAEKDNFFDRKIQRPIETLDSYFCLHRYRYNFLQEEALYRCKKVFKRKMFKNMF